MVIEAHIIAWNESETIHLTIKHYQKFCSKIIIYDNFSDDNTREIAEAMGCEVKLFGVKGVLSDLEYTKLKNNCWKGSTADWVIVCDADEILDISVDQLIQEKKIDTTIFNTYGWNIFSNELPKDNWLEIKNGIHDSNYSKKIIFNPKQIIEINYQFGCHDFIKGGPEGNVVYSKYPIILFHYKHVGGCERVANRHALYAKRLSAHNKKWRLGHQYEEDRQKTIDYFNINILNSKSFV